jgi:hypothetical protein
MSLIRDKLDNMRDTAKSDPVAKTIQQLLHRELAAVRRTVEAYPDEKSLWVEVKGIPNTGGNLALHLAGNLQHFFGTRLGNTGFVRDRDAEFARRNVPRAEVLAGLDAGGKAIDAALGSITTAQWHAEYPEKVAGRTMSTELFIIHLLSHLAYHLGQMDYHRRSVTGDSAGVGAVPVKELGTG